MSQFDQNTEKKAEENAAKYLTDEYASLRNSNFAVGRNSTKESLEILARAGNRILAVRDCGCVPCLGRCESVDDLKIYIDGLKETVSIAIAAVRVRGDWPLEEV